MKRNVVLVTGQAGDAQGWGNMHVTEAIRDALLASGFGCRIVCAENPDELKKGLDEQPFDLVWSALYFFSSRADIIGAACEDIVWVADLLDEWKIPYVGPSAQTMKNLIGKFSTHEILSKAGVRVPRHVLCPPQTAADIDFFPAFVKPNGESRSIGISDKSVAETPEALAAQIAFIQKELGQEALVEEYLPGREYTVMVIGNGPYQEILPGLVTVEKSLYGKYPILRSDLRGVGVTKISIPKDHFDEAVELARQAAAALDCRDHIRIDMREGADGKLRIMEVNGIPGLKPVRSWSPQIYALYHPGEDPYRGLIATIVGAALKTL
ncbi:MAG: hypothetical protein J5806_08355 [Lentisphaeria bacterium]|nr:hypothetical protein [Lentisphaeria bacterium]